MSKQRALFKRAFFYRSRDSKMLNALKGNNHAKNQSAFLSPIFFFFSFLKQRGIIWQNKLERRKKILDTWNPHVIMLRLSPCEIKTGLGTFQVDGKIGTLQFLRVCPKNWDYGQFLCDDFWPKSKFFQLLENALKLNLKCSGFLLQQSHHLYESTVFIYI